MNEDKKTQRRIVNLMTEFFELDDKYKEMKEKRASVRDELLDITDPGRYGPGVVYQVQEKEIHVKDYWRKSYRAIRRAKRNGKP
jgi:hypothetical protein